jgi:hypothetical protein
MSSLNIIRPRPKLVARISKKLTILNKKMKHYVIFIFTALCIFFQDKLVHAQLFDGTEDELTEIGNLAGNGDLGEVFTGLIGIAQITFTALAAGTVAFIIFTGQEQRNWMVGLKFALSFGTLALAFYIIERVAYGA